MANLIMPDTFEPYYAGREDEEQRRDKLRQPAKKRPEPVSEREIVLPSAAPSLTGEIRRDRRPVSH